MKRRGLLACLSPLVTLTAVGALAAPAQAAHGPFVGPLHTVRTIASTVPGNGDVNPYGTALIDHTEGDLRRGDVLVSNFNNKVPPSGQQGTGTTLVQVNPDGEADLFSQIDPHNLPGACPGGVGLTTALSVLPGGWVVVGSLPTTDGTAATAKAGCLIVLDKHGSVRETIAGHGINGPWDMTAVPHGATTDLFVTNVLNGTVRAGGKVVRKGTVLRLTLCTQDTHQPPTLLSTTEIGSGFAERTDPNALVIGPTGVGLGRDDTLYVADTLGNRITAIPHASTRRHSAGTGRVVTIGGALNGPLGLAIAPGDEILTVNSADGNLVDTSARGRQLAVRTLDSSGSPAGAGALFGLAVDGDQHKVYFVDDATNQLDVLERP
ncbi:hypothetical protein [Streptacidiphilus jiangxiensis]|uniref:NHL repeat-containing protein n=1 Tax=Streptacidiphilus jiangxiensis TaxID=235985 RepID=A0A1H7P4V7_STRJI|nr:hypothetical protein [Streptacidiphilus jiangxiensis]SEL30338.1 hypothetical protein SAMN05414137_107205 [Streptacidiphilus jiangxiensis]